jgi:signal transduction histidine kinase
VRSQRALFHVRTPDLPPSRQLPYMPQLKDGAARLQGGNARYPMQTMHGVLAAGQRLLRRVRLLAVLFGALAVLAAWLSCGDTTPQPLSARPPLQDLVLGLILLGLYVTFRMVRAYIRADVEREASLAKQARLEGATLAANTLSHHVNTQLALTVGYSEILADDPRLPAEVQEQANQVVSSALDVAGRMRRLDATLRSGRFEISTAVAGPPLLDIRCTDDSEPLQDPPEDPTRH